MTFIVNGIWLIMFSPIVLIVGVELLLPVVSICLLYWLLMLVVLVYLTVYQPILLGEEYLRELIAHVGGTLRQRQ